jgi:hypothetical protein
MALAISSSRSGDLAQADARYRALLGMDASNSAAINNAANVKLRLGELNAAIDLYRRSSELKPSATVLFNLSQAQGRAFKLDDHSPTLAAAQQLDVAAVAELTLLQGSEIAGFTADLELSRSALWERVLSARSGAALAAEFRSAIAPGVLGRSQEFAAAALALIAILSLVGAARWTASHACERCGRRMCPRCEPDLGGAPDCESCQRLFNQPETTDRAMRVARLHALRFRDRRLARLRVIASVLVPGVAGALARCHLTSLIGVFSATIATIALVWRHGVTPDPLVAGMAAPMVFGLISALALLFYGLSVVFALAARNRS